nr:optic atrophy 3 protein [Pelodiscus sinensis]|eukprot:XP_006134504.1 optic atrophy 3 protein [Pelodiscus sinensis]
MQHAGKLSPTPVHATDYKTTLRWQGAAANGAGDVPSFPPSPVLLAATLILPLLPPAVYHWIEMRSKMRAPRGPPKKPLNEEAAAELGAELLGEAIVFSVGGLCIFLEYARQASNTRKKEEEQSSTLLGLQEQVAELGLAVETLDTQLREVNRLLLAVSDSAKK